MEFAVGTGDRSRMRQGWFFMFFFISGFCSLVDEVVWLRIAMAQFGVLTPLVSIVLSVFMAGLPLGRFLGGGLAKRAGGLRGGWCLRRSAAAPMSITPSSFLAPP